MRMLASLVFCAVLASTALADVKTEIIAQNEAFDKAYESHDFKKLGEFYADDAVAYPQGSDILTGRAAIQKIWQSYEKDMTSVDYQTLEVIEAGEYAIQFGKYDSVYQGQPDHGRYMTVWKKTDGTWKIVRDTWYSNPSQ